MTTALTVVGILHALLAWTTVHAQDMEPRSYANTPVNLNMAGLGYTHSWGAVLVDPSLPVEDLQVDIDTVTPLYVRTLPIFGWASKLIFAWPYAYLTGEGKPYGQAVRGKREGWAATGTRPTSWARWNTARFCPDAGATWCSGRSGTWRPT